MAEAIKREFPESARGTLGGALEVIETAYLPPGTAYRFGPKPAQDDVDLEALIRQWKRITFGLPIVPEQPVGKLTIT